jgi:hypothetical protein
MEVSKKNKVETEISIWDNYKAPDKTEEPQQEYPGLTAEKVNEIVNEVFSAGRLSGGLYSQIQKLCSLENLTTLTNQSQKKT